jgi:hypothetical protein
MAVMPAVAASSLRRSLAARVAARVHSPGDVAMVARMLGWALVLPIIKHLVPIGTLVPLMRRSGSEPGGVRDASREDQIVTLARWTCRLTRWSSGGNCLERGLITYRFLGAAHAQPSLAVGIGRGEDGEIRGHAWVIVDGKPAGESLASVGEFGSVLTFGPDGEQLRTSR